MDGGSQEREWKKQGPKERNMISNGKKKGWKKGGAERSCREN